jgi:hypothetical protein
MTSGTEQVVKVAAAVKITFITLFQLNGDTHLQKCTGHIRGKKDLCVTNKSEQSYLFAKSR